VIKANEAMSRPSDLAALRLHCQGCRTMRKPQAGPCGRVGAAAQASLDQDDTITGRARLRQGRFPIEPRSAEGARRRVPFARGRHRSGSRREPELDAHGRIPASRASRMAADCGDEPEKGHDAGEQTLGMARRVWSARLAHRLRGHPAVLQPVGRGQERAPGE
jgi:hypothetical protein